MTTTSLHFLGSALKGLLTSQVLQLAKDNPKYKAIDRAIGKESFKVVTLLRLSPLLPLALSNYIYGITR